MYEWIVREGLISSEVAALVSVELTSKIVSRHNTENAAIDIHVQTNVQIFPLIISSTIGLGNLVSLKEDTLRDTRVLHAVLEDVKGVIFKIIVDDALADAVVFGGVLYNWLLEVSSKVQNLSIMLEPLGCNLGNSIILLVGTARNASKALWVTLAHGIEKVVVNGLLKRGGLFANSVVLNTEELGLVVSGDSGIAVDITRQEGQLIGKVL